MELEKFYDKTYDWILRNGPGLILAIIILLVGLWIIRLVKKGIVRGMEKRKFLVDPLLRTRMIQ